MSQLVFDDRGRALLFDRVTGEVGAYSVPTAIENVALGKGRFVHGRTGERMAAEPVVAVAPEPVIPLVDQDVLPLPAAEPEPAHAVEPPAPPRPRPRRAK